MDNIIKQFCVQNGYSVSEIFSQEPRAEKRRPLPYGYEDQYYADILRALGIEHAQVWEHQAEALEAVSSGLNAVLSTGTASGKSLIFQLAALHKLKSRGGDARVLALYPTRALNNDQKGSWQKLMAAAGYEPEALGMIDGSVPVAERLTVIEKAKVLLMTPDSAHAWLMANLAQPAVRHFISELNFKILDEAHFYDGAFGTNMYYLLQRIALAQRTLNPSFRQDDHGQIVMATATLANPRRFAHQLTGYDAWTIAEEGNTSPRYPRTFMVIRTPDSRRREAVHGLLILLSQKNTSGSTLAFIDSRSGVDQIALDVNSTLGADAFSAYRAGLTGEDRASIEQSLREAGASLFSSPMRGVVTTSALEAGIDIKGISCIVLDGVPDSPSSFIQRVGRLRHGGHVFVVEGASRLDVRAHSVEHHLSSRPAQPVFYRNNPKLQAENAQTLLAEISDTGSDDALLNDISWPSGFLETVRAYGCEAPQLTPIQRQAIPPKRITPHLYHSLRYVDGPARRLLRYNPAVKQMETVGEVTQKQALLEALPGMVVTVNHRRFRVKDWGPYEGSPIIVRSLSPEEGRVRTKARVETDVRVYINTQGIVSKRLRSKGKNNLMADCRLSFIMTASGFTEENNGESTRYFFDSKQKEGEDRETYVRDKDRTVITSRFGAPRKYRMDTTGTLIRIDGGVMNTSDMPRFAKLMVRALCEKAGISPRDIGVQASNISIRLSSSEVLTDMAFIIYDTIPGSLRFSSKIMTNTDAILEHMLSIVNPSDMVMVRALDNFIAWQASLRRTSVPTYDEWLRKDIKIDASAHQIEAYTPGSRIFLNNDGQKSWVTIIDAKVVHSDLVYEIQIDDMFIQPQKSGPAKRLSRASKKSPERILVPHSRLERPDIPTYRIRAFNLEIGKYVDADGPIRSKKNQQEGIALAHIRRNELV